MASKRFQAVCDRCYTCILITAGKREAERTATSHIGAYPGHNVTLLAVPAKVKAERKPEYGSQQWAETYADDLGESED